MLSRPQRNVVFAAAVFLISCATNQAGGPRAPGIPVVVTPSSARPGDVVRVGYPHGDLKSRHGLHATIGDQTAVILRVPDDDFADIIVPIVPPDTAAVVVGDEDGTFLTGRLYVEETATVLVVLALPDSVPQLLRVVASVDAATGDVLSNEDRLSFDLVNSSNVVVHSCSVLDPLRTPGELIAPSGPGGVTASRQGMSADPTVTIRLPRIAGTGTLSVFQVPPGVDVRTPGGRARRIPITDIVVTF